METDNAAVIAMISSVIMARKRYSTGIRNHQQFLLWNTGNRFEADRIDITSILRGLRFFLVLSFGFLDFTIYPSAGEIQAPEDQNNEKTYSARSKR